MNFNGLFPAITIVPVVINLFSLLVKREKVNCGIVSMPKWAFIFGTVFGVAAMIMSIFGLFDNSSDIIIAIYGICVVLFFLFTVMYYSLRIYYDKQGFTVKRLFRRTRHYKYTDITCVIRGSNLGYTIIVGKNRVFIDGYTVGGQEFFCFAESKYNQAGNGVSIPERKPKLFNGYVKEPVPIVVICAIIGFGVLLAAIWITALDFSRVDTAVYVTDSESYQKVYDNDEGQYQSQNKGYAEELVLIWAITILTWAFFLSGYYILCHAPEHPKIAALLIKKDYRNW